MRSRILPDSTEKMVARAIDDYGETPVDVRYDIFAKLVADGAPKRQAYQRIYPDASDNTASCRASILLAHPVIRDKVMRHLIGARDMAIALTPEALQLTYELAHGMHEASPKVRLDAASSIQDRGGLPRSKEIAISARMAALEAIATIPGALEPIEGEMVDDIDQPDDRALEDSSDTADPLAEKRLEWDRLLPRS
jgi:hypothetical protein